MTEVAETEAEVVFCPSEEYGHAVQWKGWSEETNLERMDATVLARPKLEALQPTPMTMVKVSFDRHAFARFEIMAWLRRSAEATLPPGTRYEIRTMQRDYDRLQGICWLYQPYMADMDDAEWDFGDRDAVRGTTPEASAA
jgi:hypothetical protein